MKEILETIMRVMQKEPRQMAKSVDRPYVSIFLKENFRRSREIARRFMSRVAPLV